MRQRTPARDRREKVKVALSEAERSVIEHKMKQYGYSTIAGYVRDACIYENIIIEKVEGRKEILDTTGECIILCRKILNNQESILMKPSLTKEDIVYLKSTMDNLVKHMDETKKIITNKMKVTYNKESVREKILQQALRLESEEK